MYTMPSCGCGGTRGILPSFSSPTLFFPSSTLSLYLWQDHSRSNLFLFLLVFLALLFTVVPFRYLFGGFSLLLLTKPFRDPRPGMLRLGCRRFWSGLAPPSTADAVYSEALPDFSSPPLAFVSVVGNQKPQRHIQSHGNASQRRRQPSQSQ